MEGRHFFLEGELELIDECLESGIGWHHIAGDEGELLGGIDLNIEDERHLAQIRVQMAQEMEERGDGRLSRGRYLSAR